MRREACDYVWKEHSGRQNRNTWVPRNGKETCVVGATEMRSLVKLMLFNTLDVTG